MFWNLFLVALLATSVLSIVPNHYHFHKHLNKVRLLRHNNDVSVTTGYLNQKLDHSGNNSETFTQRYLYSQQYALHAKTAFLYVSTNGDFDKAVITDERNPIVKSAKQFGATVFALEHRFYGMSKPAYDNYNGTTLCYLNSFQAIQDIIYFIKYANVQFNLDPDVRWVLWGAGYGGVIAAEARKCDPVTISGVISSSAPLDRLLDFYAFNDQVEKLIRQEGGDTCYKRVKQGFTDIRYAMRSPEGRDEISRTFNLNPALSATNLTYNDIQTFYLAIIAPFQQIAQSNNAFNLSITGVCQQIEKTNWKSIESVYQAYVYLSTTLTGSVQPMVTSYSQIFADLGNPASTNPYLDQRMWQWQVCTEFGWFYTTNNHENGLFGAVVPTNLFINQCIDFFPDANINISSISDSVFVNAKLHKGAKTYEGTNAVFTNGELDPWSVLGKKNSHDFSVVTYEIPGSSFASDFFPGDSDNIFIQKAHVLMAENIRNWVNGLRNPKTFVNTTIPWKRPPWGEHSLNVQKHVTKEDVESKFSKLGDEIPSKKHPESEPDETPFRRHGFMPIPVSRARKDYPHEYEEGTFRQRLDHFDNKNSNHFQQGFYKNAQFAKPGGPNFLYVGGEGAGDSSTVLTNQFHVTLAKKYGATLYSLEHRFYGKGDNLVGNNTDFKLLSSLQMLYDLAEFIKAVNLKTGTNNPWITFGGSYAGALSAWMREVFPDLVVGAVASSGPVFAQTDFYGYVTVTEDAIRRYNPECVDNIRISFDRMQQLFLTKEGRDTISALFELKVPFGGDYTDVDQHYFLMTITEDVVTTAQYSFDSIHPFSGLCDIMTNSSNTPVENIATFSKNVPGIKIIRNYKEKIDIIRNSNSHHLWLWQTCSEFGYYGSTDSGTGMFGSAAPVNVFIQQCIDIFGEEYDRAKIDSLVEYTNYKYGGRSSFRGTNVVFTNGNVDPWSGLGLYEPTDDSVVSYLINGGAHCQEMLEESPNEAPDSKVARKIIDDNIAIWLGLSNSTETSEGTTATPTEATTKYASYETVLMSFIALIARFIL